MNDSPLVSCVACVATFYCSSLDAALVDFVNGAWDHGSGSVTGWQTPAIADTDGYMGTTTLANGIAVTITATDFSVSHPFCLVEPHLSADTAGGGSGLRLAQNSASAANSVLATLTDYTRIDVFLFEAAFVDMYFHDIDRSTDDWRDALYVESYDTGVFGVLGSGDLANYIELGWGPLSTPTSLTCRVWTTSMRIPEEMWTCRLSRPPRP